MSRYFDKYKHTYTLSLFLSLRKKSHRIAHTHNRILLSACVPIFRYSKSHTPTFSLAFSLSHKYSVWFVYVKDSILLSRDYTTKKKRKKMLEWWFVMLLCVCCCCCTCVWERILSYTHTYNNNNTHVQQQHTLQQQHERPLQSGWFMYVRSSILFLFFLFSFAYIVHVKNVIATGLHDPKKKLVRVCRGLYLVLTARHYKKKRKKR